MLYWIAGVVIEREGGFGMKTDIQLLEEEITLASMDFLDHCYDGHSPDSPVYEDRIFQLLRPYRQLTGYNDTYFDLYDLPMGKKEEANNGKSNGQGTVKDVE